MYSVEISIRQRDEKAVTAQMSSMREWLDHQRFEPSSFRYKFDPPRFVFRVEFKQQAEAIALARAFDGQLEPVTVAAAV